ncbi:MAG: hypothetical protein WCD89_03765 [Anaerocolumna sp.]
MNDQKIYPMQNTMETFQAFVDAIIPRTPGLAEEYGLLQYYGALDLDTAECMIMSLDHYYIPLAGPTAEMLNITAERLIYMEGYDRHTRINGNTFAALSPIDRFRVITLLDELEADLITLPEQFRNNPWFKFYILSVLNRFTMMGYYSEWSGYGSTRLESPNNRTLEFFPLSWQQVGYPGPSLGYHALRI